VRSADHVKNMVLNNHMRNEGREAVLFITSLLSLATHIHNSAIMSTTATETAPAPAQTQAPEVTVLSRVASIPMISSSLNTINEALSSNTYTRSPYAHAKELSSSAYKFTEPLQVKLAPLIVRADGYANKAVDAVESRYPYPFKAQPEEVATLVRERKESTTNYVSERVNDVNKAIDANVKTPALNVAHDIDQVSLGVCFPDLSELLFISFQ
jgi:hypothetical protein